jgi:hypothetical protein
MGFWFLACAWHFSKASRSLLVAPIHWYRYRSPFPSGKAATDRFPSPPSAEIICGITPLTPTFPHTSSRNDSQLSTGTLIYFSLFFSAALQANSDPCRLIVEISRSHAIRHTHPVGLLWMSDQLVAEAATFTTHNKHNRRKSISSAKFEPEIPAIERFQTYALVRRPTVSSVILTMEPWGRWNWEQ